MREIGDVKAKPELTTDVAIAPIAALFMFTFPQDLSSITFVTIF